MFFSPSWAPAPPCLPSIEIRIVMTLREPLSIYLCSNPTKFRVGGSCRYRFRNRSFARDYFLWLFLRSSAQFCGQCVIFKSSRAGCWLKKIHLYQRVWHDWNLVSIRPVKWNLAIFVSFALFCTNLDQSNVAWIAEAFRLSVVFLKNLCPVLTRLEIRCLQCVFLNSKTPPGTKKLAALKPICTYAIFLPIRR